MSKNWFCVLIIYISSHWESIAVLYIMKIAMFAAICFFFKVIKFKTKYDMNKNDYVPQAFKIILYTVK